MEPVRKRAGVVLGLALALSSYVGLSSSAQSASGGALRRLTRAEYANSVRDLFGMSFPVVAELPADGQAAGFDNNGNALSLSPLLLEGYLKVARKIADQVLGTGPISAVTETFPATDLTNTWQEGLPMATRGGMRVEHFFPRTGEYELRATLDSVNVLRQRESLVNPLTPTEGVRSFRTRIATTAGMHTLFVTFPDDYAAREGAVPNLDSAVGAAALGGPVDIRGSAFTPTLQFWLDGRKIKTFDIHGPSIGEAAHEVQPGPPVLERAEITGPFNPRAQVMTPQRQRIMTCTPRRHADEETCALRILTPLTRLAYRREVSARDMEPILAAFQRKRAQATFDEAIGMGLRRILVSPDFLFRLELDPPNAAAGHLYRVSDAELATRLSFFIWSSIPDDELLEQSQRGRLQDASELERQVRRLLADSRADALVDNFATQWLDLRSLEAVRPDAKAYPEFDDSLALVFMQETRLFLRTLIRENRSILDLVSGDYTFLNARLAKLYGIDGIEGSAFRRVPLTDGVERGGILGHASVLMLSSHPAQTSPILRGKWILTSLLNSPPPPPPPGVPPLDTKPSADGRVLTTREQIERHRSSPACASCHSKMDPYGMALENYDVIGRWRREENGTPIDASAQLRGQQFVGPAGLKKVLLARSDELANAAVSRLMSYALGRALDADDRPAIEQIVTAVKPAGYRFADIIVGIVMSAPFQMRQALVAPAGESSP